MLTPAAPGAEPSHRSTERKIAVSSPTNRPTRRVALAGLGATALSPLIAPRAGAASVLAHPTSVPALASKASTLAKFGTRRPTYWGMYAPGVISRFSTATTRGRGAVCLTFDACGGSVTRYDAALIAALRANKVPATLFVNRTWAARNPSTFEELLHDPLFEIENHGSSHQPLSVSGRSAWGIAGSRNLSQVWDEIVSAHDYFASTYGYRTRYMRAGTAYTDDVASAAAVYMGQPAVSFSVNIDGGATLPAASVYAQLLTVRPGDIAIGHFNHPGGGTAPGVARALPVLKARGIRFARLADVL